MPMNGYSLQRILVHPAREGFPDLRVRSETHHGVLTFLVTARRPEPGSWIGPPDEHLSGSATGGGVALTPR